MGEARQVQVAAGHQQALLRDIIEDLEAVLRRQGPLMSNSFVTSGRGIWISGTWTVSPHITKLSPAESRR